MMLCPVLLLSTENQFELEFNDKTRSASVYKSVLIGDTNNYHFKAKAGQSISILSSSLDNQLIVELLYKKDGEWVGVDVKREDNKINAPLPASDSDMYNIQISAENDFASYELYVNISDGSHSAK